MLGPIAITALCLSLYLALDDRCLLDSVNKTVFFRRRFLGRISKSPVCGFGELAAEVVTSKMVSKENSRRWWEYALSLRFFGAGVHF